MMKKILQCPECNNRFRVPANAIGAAGRKVRCAACKHVWYAERGELQFDDELESVSDDASRAFLSNEATEKTAFDALMSGESLEAITGKKSALDDIEALLARVEAPDSTDIETIIVTSAEEADADFMPAPKIDTLFPDVRSSRVDIKTQAAIKRYAHQRSMLVVANVACGLAVLLLGLLVYRDAIVRAVPIAAPFYAAVGYHVTDALTLGDIVFAHETIHGKKEYKVKGLMINNAEDDAPVPTVRARLINSEGGIIQEGDLTKDRVLPAKDDESFELNIETDASVNASTLSLELGSPVELLLRK
jgi:predicted Zn finger-like uncharacterized protein